jgi:hypothetical protein
MTAVFAFADRGVAFVAADTRRTPSGKPNHHFTATKFYRWSDEVLLVQSGEAHALTRLILQMLRSAPLIPSDSGFITNFGALHQRYWRVAQKIYGAQPPPRGNVLVVAAGLGASKITSVDFQTGNPQPISGNHHAEGSAPSQFQAIAAQELARLGSGTNVQLDAWGASCIERAIAAVPTNPHVPGPIGWPADLVISRVTGSSDRTVIHRRTHHAIGHADPMFLA